MANLETIHEIFLMLSTAYPKNELNQTTIELYAKLLADLDDELLKAATLDHISKSQWFPTIAELRGAANKISTPELEPAAEAWGIAHNAMCSCGRTWNYKFANPIITKCMDSMNWNYLCMSTNSVADRARFIELYNEYVRRFKESSETLPMVKALADSFRLPALPAKTGQRDYDPVLDGDYDLYVSRLSDDEEGNLS